MDKRKLAAHIDHTILYPTTRDEDIATLCKEAHDAGCAAVCIMPYYVPLAVNYLAELESSVAICATIGFPLGAHQSVIKVAEARKAIEDGAQELDMVMNIGALKSGHTAVVMADIRAVTMAAHPKDVIVKVIIETALLTDDEKRLACELATDAQADYVKTSTGFGPAGATVEDVRLIRKAAHPSVKIKAAGGIRDYVKALAMLDAGADRIGASRTLDILEGAAD